MKLPRLAITLSICTTFVCWHAVRAESPIILLKDHTNTYPPLNLNDSPRSSESSKEKASKLAKAHTDNIDAYTRGLTPQFRTLLLAPDSTEGQHFKKPTKESQKERVHHEAEEKAETIYPGIENVPQAHLNQLLRYYGKITGKFLPQGYAKFRKISTDPEKDDKQDELEVKESPVTVEPPNSESKIPPNTDHVVNTAVNAAISALRATSAFPGYGALNYLNAASYGPPRPQNAYLAAALRNQMANYLPAPNGYGIPNCCNVCPPCNTQSIYNNGCGGGIPVQGGNNMGISGMINGCAGSDYNTMDTDNDEYGSDGYLQGGGGYGSTLSSHENVGEGHAGPNRHSQLLNGYSSQSNSNPSSYGSINPQSTSYYQVSSPISTPFLVDAHPYSPIGSIFATSHMHHFGSHPSLSGNPLQQYYGTLSAYPNRLSYGNSPGDVDLGSQNMFGYGVSPFEPMFDYASNVTNDPEIITTQSPKRAPAKPTDKQEHKEHSEKPLPIESIFHIVKPNFASLKKVALMKKHRTTSTKPTPSPEPISIKTSTTTTVPATTKSVVMTHKTEKTILIKKTSTYAPTNATTLKKDVETGTANTPTSTTKIITHEPGQSIDKTKKKRSGSSNALK